MLFSRRQPLDAMQRLRAGLWPKRGWRRAARYQWLRLCRTPGSPHAIAIGFAAGIFAAFVPLLGIQMTLAAILAYLMGGSLLGALAGTFVGTPVTYPVMWIGSYRLGAWLLGHPVVRLDLEVGRLFRLAVSGSRGAADQAASLLVPIVKPLLFGSLLLGLAAAAAAYYSLVLILARMQARRRARLMPLGPDDIATPPV